MKPSQPDNSEISILYVEDDPAARGFLGKAMTVKYPTMKVYTAENGEIGLELFKKHTSDIVLTDISMPVMDGIRMAREIKALKSDANIIVITAHSETHYLLDIIKIGLLRCVLKPIDFEQLFEAIDDCLVRVTLERQVAKQNEHIRKLSSAVEQSPSSIIITDVKGTIEYVNPKFTELTGYSQEEAIGQNPRILRTGNTPPELYRQLWSTITSGFDWHGEILNRKKNGDLYWETASISPLFNEKGKITHFIGVNEDITERKRMEEDVRVLNRKLATRAEQLEDSNKELEAFSYSAAHDLKAPLRHINIFSDMLEKEAGAVLQHDTHDYLLNIHKSVRNMTRLVDGLLSLSTTGRRPLELEKTDLSEVLDEALAEVKAENPGREIEWRTQKLPALKCDRSMMRQVLVNLLGNAAKYSRGSRPARIEVFHAAGPREHVVAVRDNGIGFSMEYADKVFGVFQRLHKSDDYEGTGIGLSTVKRIVSRHGGRVWAESEPGKGSTFFFALPSQ